MYTTTSLTLYVALLFNSFQKIVTVVLALLGMVGFVYSAQAEANCANVPARVALNFSFDWALADQQEFTKNLVVDCGDTITEESLAAIIEDALIASGITVDDIEPFSIPNAEDNGVLNLVIYTPEDSAVNKTVIMPVTVTGMTIDDFIHQAELVGAAEEGGELVLRFAVDARTVSLFNARPLVAWKRDGVIIQGETRARYELNSDDVGRSLSAELIIRSSDDKELARRSYVMAEKIVGVEKPPAISGLQILGNAELGQRLRVGYQFADPNQDDREDGSRINWYRNDVVVKTAQGAFYPLVEDDLGAEISVEIIPRSADGIEGEAVRAVLAEAIRAPKMQQGQQRPTLTLSSEVIAEALASKQGAKPTSSLTLQKLVDDIQRPNNEAQEDVKVTEELPKAPPKKPAQKLAKKASAKPSADQSAKLDRSAIPHPPLPPAPPPKPVINVPAVPLTDDEKYAIAASAKSVCFEVDDINLENSTILVGDKKTALLGKFINQCTTPELVGEVLSILNNYYIDLGYVTTRAYVAPQDLKDGTLDIVIVEGRIESIAFYDDASKDINRIDFAFPVAEEDVLNINDLERGLDQMNVPISNRVTMNMVPGSKPGYSVIELSEEKISPSYRFKIGLDNLGSQGTGEDRLTLGFDADNVFNYSDTWSISHIGSLDTNALAISGTIPYGYWTYGASYSYSDYLSYIDSMTQIFGKSETSEIKADRLFHKSKGNEFSFKSSLTKKTSKRTIGDVRLASQRMAVARVGFGFSRKTNSVFSGNVYLARGLEIFGAMRDLENPEPGTPEAQFTKVQFDASYYQPVFANIFLQSALAGQLADSALYGSEQITAGGKTSVRGFARNTIAGDSGIYVQNDILFPMPQVLMWEPLREYVAAIKPFAGFDFAYINNRATYESNGIAGIGLGAKYAKGSITADLGIGAPLWRERGSRNNKIEKYVKILYEALEF